MNRKTDDKNGKPKKECPMERMACVDCPLADKRLRCTKGYIKIAGDAVIHPGKKIDPKTRW